jgi:gamma-glutamylcyclotransferase (GGCT)/AIG2-like uncharacterized protein YtfP
MTDRLFVYGTLQPGDVRWSFLEPFVAGDAGGEPDTVQGRVYDTGLGYPAAVFTEAGTIHGRVYRLRTDSLDRALAVLDAEESSVAGQYRRIEVTTRRGLTAHAYEYGGGLTLRPIAGGRRQPAAT